jgi:hypothetical protein
VSIGNGLKLFIEFVLQPSGLREIPLTSAGPINFNGFVSAFMDPAPVIQQSDPNHRTSPAINYDTARRILNGQPDQQPHDQRLRLAGGSDPTLTLNGRNDALH